MGHSNQKIGVVVIGRNEGERLKRSLDSVATGSHVVVYVDSGSIDGSQAAARERGVELVELDMSIPFTAARARNAGFSRLRELCPDAQYVQFIDGDCEVATGWIAYAAQMLDTHKDVVAVCGWRRERYPDRTVYNRICEVEWRNDVLGYTTCFGGDVMLRTASLAAVNGYDDLVIAAEDNELSARLLAAGGKILKVDKDCTLHDAAMTRFSQWWQRAKRCGFGYAQVSGLHNSGPDRLFAKEVRRYWLWGAVLPAIALLFAPSTYGASLLIFGRYPVIAARTAMNTQRLGFSWLDSIAWGVSCSLSVFPGLMGMIAFYRNRYLHKQNRIIEYKGARPPGVATISQSGVKR